MAENDIVALKELASGGFLEVALAPADIAAAPASHTHAAADITDLATNGNAAALWDEVAGQVGLEISDYTLKLYGDAGAVDIDTSNLTAGRAIAFPDATGTLALTSDLQGEVRSDFVSPYTYTGIAAAGTSQSTASWKIRRSEFDAAGTHVATLTATAVSWNNRLTASYS